MSARTLIAALFISAVFASQFAHVAATNFSGYDEWLYLTLSSRGIISFPYQNRPLVLLWHLPPAILGGGLATFHAAHAGYLLLGGLTAFAIVRRARPASLGFAYLAGTLAAVWAPMDHARLMGVTLAGYAGWTLLVLLATLAFLEACLRSSAALLAAAAALTAVAARGAEATLPLAAAGPIVAWWAGAAVTPRFRRWLAAWAAAVLAAGLSVVVPLLRGGEAVAYQTGLGLDLDPLAALGRLVRQFGFHLLPAVTASPRALAAPGPLLSAGLFAAGAFAVARAAHGEDAALAPREALRAAAVGVLLAALGYGAFTLTAALPNPVRTQFLSAAGVGILLAALIAAVAGRAGRGRTLLIAAAGAWLCAAATAYTIGMQRDWDAHSSYPAQAGVLRALRHAAPALAPNTLVVLLDDGAPAFPATFAFLHAIEHAYGRGVRGCAWGAAEFLYVCRPTAEGIAVEPWPVIREPWGMPVTAHRPDEMVVARRAGGRLSIEESWPAELGPLPAGARYAPAARMGVPGRPLL